jgi:hypothetical protein
MKQPKVDEPTLRRFAENGHSLAEAAAHFGIPYTSMPYWCKRYKISFRGNTQRKPVTEKPKAAPKEPKISGVRLADLYRQVVEVRQHMRRLAYRERQLLDAIGKEMDENV